MRDEANIRQLEKLSPDFMGFIFYPKSPRYVGKDPVIPVLDDKITKVGVFVKEPAERVIELAERYELSHVQLHSGEDEAYCEIIKSKGLKILKAVSVGETFNFKTLQSFEGLVDYFLFDTAGDSYGGHGQSFHWGILNDYSLEVPFFVAGGISNDNIGQLLKLDHPQFIGVDVNSKFEDSPGLKNIEALKKLFLQVRNTEQ